MPIGSSNISMQGIANEKQSTQLPAATQNISLKGLSVDGVNDFQFVGGALTDIAVAGSSPDQAAPHRMGEFSGYEQFAWGTPTVPSGSNVSKIFSMFQESRSGNDTCVVCSFKMTLNTTTKIIAISIAGTDDGGGFSPDFTGPTMSIGYSGVLSSLQARFVMSGANFTITGSGNSANGKVLELFSNSGHISNAHINNNSITGSVVTSNNDISGGANGTFQSLRTTSGNMSVALAATSDGGPSTNDSSRGSISFSGSDSLTIQLKANNSTSVNLFSKSGTFSMHSETSEEGSS